MKMMKQSMILYGFVLVLPHFVQAITADQRRQVVGVERFLKVIFRKFDSGTITFDELKRIVAGKTTTLRTLNAAGIAQKYDDMLASKTGKSEQDMGRLEKEFDEIIKNNLAKAKKKLDAFVELGRDIAKQSEVSEKQKLIRKLLSMIKEGLGLANALENITTFYAKLTAEQKSYLKDELIEGVSSLVFAKQMYAWTLLGEFGRDLFELKNSLDGPISAGEQLEGKQVVEKVKKVFEFNNTIMKTAYYAEAVHPISDEEFKVARKYFDSETAPAGVFFISDKEFNMAKKFFKEEEEDMTKEEKIEWDKVKGEQVSMENELFKNASTITKLFNSIKDTVQKARTAGLIDEAAFSEIIEIIDQEVREFVEGYNRNIRMVTQEKLKLSLALGN